MSFLSETGLATLWSKIVGKSIPYGYCETAKGTVAKTVTVSPTVSELTTGLTILVRFKNENTSSNPTLKVNNTTATAIKRYGTTAPSTSGAGSWQAGEVCLLTYNGTYWMLANWNNTTYSSMTIAEIEAGSGTTARTITPARLKTAIETWATGEANVQSDWSQTDNTADDYIKNKPTNVSDFTNDAGYLTSYTETDPVFTASPAYGITSNDITGWNNKVTKSGDTDIGNLLFGTGNGIGFKYLDNTDTAKLVRIDSVTGSSGYRLNFNGFIIGAQSNNPVRLTNVEDPTADSDVSTKKYVDNQVATKVDKVTGKDLSTEDYTTAEKTKLAGISANATAVQIVRW